MTIPSQLRLAYRNAPALAVFIAVLILLVWPAIPDTPFGYDEADYMFAAGMGFVANYTDTPTVPVVEFLRIGWSRGMDARQRSGLSELIRAANDIVFYRHWHGPLYFYWLAPVSRLNPGERAMRVSMLVFPVCSLFWIYFGCLSLFPGLRGRLAAALSSALFLWSVTTIRSTELAPHQPFVCAYLASLVCLAKTVVTGNRRYFYFAVVAAALACCLLEVGFVVVATLLVCGFLERRRLRAGWAFASRSLLLFAATTAIVWPGAIWKLSFVKGYLFMTYLAVTRASPWGSTGLFAAWKARFLASPVEWVLILVSVALLLRRPRPEGWSRLYPFVVYSVLMLAVTLKATAGTARYALPFQPALELLAGCVMSAYLVKLRPLSACALASILAVALLVPTWLNLRLPVPRDLRSPALLSYIQENHLERSRLLAPQTDIPLLHYYFPRTQLRGYSGNPPEWSAIADRQVDGILYPDFPIRFRSAGLLACAGSEE